MPLLGQSKTARTVIGLTVLFLAIELVDELIDGVWGAALPLIRTDLHLSYVQVGMLLTIPGMVGNVIEPILGIWADIKPRRQLILAGGVAFAVALLLISFSDSFPLLLASFVLLNPASGCFVSLSQATLMDIEPTRHEQNMARWTLAGSLGNVIGPAILVIAIAFQQGWRGAFLILAVLTAFVLCLLWKSPIATPNASSTEPTASFQAGIGKAIKALQRSEVLRWLILLQFSDLMLDVLRGFVALYFVDVVGASNIQAGLAYTIWLGFGLVGDFLLVPLLERVRGLSYLRISVLLVLGFYPAFLLIPNFTVKLILVGCLGFLNAGWYAILQGQLYSAMPGQSGTVVTLSNVFGLVGGLAPLALGFVAQQVGLQSTMWILIAAPIALLIGLSRR